MTILNLVSSKQNSETREITFNNIRYVTTMKIIILGSGGGTEIPRPFCQCRICQEAMKKDIPYSRNALAVYIEDLKALLETPEDISDSLTRWEIRDVDYIFLSHWHPDHTFGLRPVLQAYYDWNQLRIKKYIGLYISKLAYQKLIDIFGALQHFQKVQGVRVHQITSNTPIKIKNCQVTFIPTEREDIGGFLFEYAGKRILFASCDMKKLQEEKLTNLDLLIHECGWFPNDLQGNVLVKKSEIWSQEIQFEETLERVTRLRPKQTILIGLEEVYQRSYFDYKQLEEQYGNLGIKFAYDGMEINV